MSAKCKGCKTNVANPTKCSDCGAVSHPSDTCLGRSCHPWHSGRLLSCKTPILPSVAPNSPSTHTGSVTTSPPTLEDIKGLIRVELANFRKELWADFKADMSDVRNSVALLSDRMQRIEERMEDCCSPSANLPADVGPVTEGVLTELSERGKRSSNLIVYGLEEDPNVPVHHSTQKDAENICIVLSQIYASDYQHIRARRIGRLAGSSPRPLCVTLQSVDIVKSVLRNKSSYTGPLKITDDKTPMQRSNLKRLRQQLSELHANGDTDKTIRYVNGVPTIVPSASSSVRRSKNAH